MGYRSEIDGLRAVAVISVFLFHLFPEFLPGGFLGVDIFFVISGFLITSIIYEKSKNNNFSIKEFWVRRIKRLFPIFSLVIFCTLIMGYLFLLPNEFQDLGEQSLSALFGISNFKLFYSAGYWSKDALDLPLLHTWSLSIEEQFYLVLVFIFVIKSKFKKQNLAMVFLLLFSSSLALASYMAFSKADFVFYMLPTRAWELLAGCILALNQKAFIKNTKGIALITNTSMVVLIVSFVLFDETSTKPNLVFVFPILATVLFLHFSKKSSSITNKVLNLKPIIFIGKISYSLYLWHWPIITFYKHLLYPDELSSFDYCFITVLSFTLSSLSYLYVEQPCRKGKLIKSAYLLAFISLISVSFLIMNRNISGLPKIKYISGEYSKTYGASIDQLPYIKNYNSKETSDILFIGSSHARMHSDLMNQVAAKNNLNIAFYTNDGHPALPPKTFTTKFQQRFYGKRESFIQSKQFKLIIIGERFDNIYESDKRRFNQNYIDFLNKLSKNCDKLIIIQQAPRCGVTRNLEKHVNLLSAIKPNVTIQEKESHKITRQAINKIQKGWLKELKGSLTIIPVEDKFLYKENIIFANDENVLLYKDDHHLSLKGSNLLKDRIEKTILNLIGK